jgi:hypothetical protein
MNRITRLWLRRGATVGGAVRRLAGAAEIDKLDQN